MPSNAETTLPIQTMVSGVCPMVSPRAVYGVRLSTCYRTFISALTWAPLRNMECTLSAESATATLVHAFVANRLDYCSSLYAGLPACQLACLDRVLRSAARLIGGIPNFGHVSKYMLDVLNWLPAEQRISYRIASIVWRCLLGLAPLYLRELCCPLHSAMSSRSLRSSQQGLLLVPFARASAKQSRAFSVVGSSIWNGLPSELRIFPRALSPAFFTHLKTAFSRAGVRSASE